MLALNDGVVLHRLDLTGHAGGPGQGDLGACCADNMPVSKGRLSLDSVTSVPE
jgi:hypothetical protein